MLHRLRHHPLRDSALACVFAALLLRALVPDGFMLGMGHGTALTVQLCTDSGYHEMVVHYGDDGRPVSPAPGHGSERHCPFAASALLAPPTAQFVATALPASRAAPVPTPELQVLPPEHAVRPATRAPPPFT
jgi:hypothetical protein